MRERIWIWRRRKKGKILRQRTTITKDRKSTIVMTKPGTWTWWTTRAETACTSWFESLTSYASSQWRLNPSTTCNYHRLITGVAILSISSSSSSSSLLSFFNDDIYDLIQKKFSMKFVTLLRKKRKKSFYIVANFRCKFSDVKKRKRNNETIIIETWDLNLSVQMLNN